MATYKYIQHDTVNLHINLNINKLLKYCKNKYRLTVQLHIKITMLKIISYNTVYGNNKESLSI